ncbi:hypothetical protein CDD83_9687 [Cordyceps sp. RAO-2017]|nr:hypothetical protein CDD83_9687 [Cordyceps sp. RAO-2017]
MVAGGGLCADHAWNGASGPSPALRSKTNDLSPVRRGLEHSGPPSPISPTSHQPYALPGTAASYLPAESGGAVRPAAALFSLLLMARVPTDIRRRKQESHSVGAPSVIKSALLGWSGQSQVLSCPRPPSARAERGAP